MNSIKINEQSLKKSWLNGKVNMRYPGQLLYGPVHQFAQPFFKSWTENEARTCWKEFEIILNEYIKKQGKKNYITNPIVIITKILFMLECLKSYQSFKIKWDKTFEKINPPKVLHPKKPNTLIMNPVYPRHIIGALYILNHASKGKIAKVMEAYTLLSEYQQQEIKISLAEEEGVRKNVRRAAKGKRNSLKSLLREIIRANQNCTYLDAWRKILKSPPDKKKQYKISEVDSELIKRTHGIKPTTKENFKILFYKVRREFKSK